MKAIRILNCLFFFILFSNSRLKAQSWEQLNDSFYYYYKKEDFTLALPIAQKIVGVARNDFGENDQAYATALLYGTYEALADLYGELSDLQTRE